MHKQEFKTVIMDPNQGANLSFSVYLQVNNESAISFYRNFGFDVVETKQNYYKRIEPADAFVLEKKIDKTVNGTASVSTTSSSS